MKTNLLLKTAMVVSLSVACNGSFALTATTHFSASVPETFTLAPLGNTGSDVQAPTGVMSLATGSLTRLTSSAMEGTGAPVSYTINTSIPATSVNISVANPVPISAIAIAAFAGNIQYGAEIRQNGNLINAISKGGATTFSSMLLGNFDVSVYLDNGATPLPPGDYTVSVTTTVLPN